VEPQFATTAGPTGAKLDDHTHWLLFMTNQLPTTSMSDRYTAIVVAAG
jgi:hypothetical protein